MNGVLGARRRRRIESAAVGGGGCALLALPYDALSTALQFCLGPDLARLAMCGAAPRDAALRSVDKNRLAVLVAKTTRGESADSRARFTGSWDVVRRRT